MTELATVPLRLYVNYDRVHSLRSDEPRAIGNGKSHNPFEGITRQPEWMRRGDCGAVDPDIFFEERGSLLTLARRICSTCPVFETCRDYGIETHQEYGVWGGLTREDRKRIWRKTHEGPSPDQPRAPAA